MKFSSITKNGIKLDIMNLEPLGQDIVNILESKGFITKYSINNGKLKVGMHMKSFVINAKKLGYNSRYSPYKDKPHRTSTPSWEQRVEYNDTINDIMDQYGLEAVIKNSVFIIRDKQGRKTEQDWHNEKPEFMHHNEDRGFSVIQGYGE